MYLYILAPHAYTNRVLHATPGNEGIICTDPGIQGV